MFRALIVLISTTAVILSAAEPDGRWEARRQAAAAAPQGASVAMAPVLKSASPSVAAGAPGIGGISVTMGDPDGVARYERIEYTLTLTGLAGLEFYEPDPDRDGVDLSAVFTRPDVGGSVSVHGFYDGSDWKVRFAPDTLGSWTGSISVTTGGGTADVDVAFDCNEGSSKGFLRIDGRALRYAEGDRFFGVGYNTGWMYEVRIPGLDTLADRGGNLLSFWMSVPWAYPSWASPSEPYWSQRSALENAEGGIGYYQPEAGHYLDAVVADAEASGVHLLPAIWVHDQLRDSSHSWLSDGNWYDNPYSTLLADPAEWFERTTLGGDDTEQWIRQRNLLRYIIARWGSSSAIAGWVSLTEMDGTNGYEDDEDMVVDWCSAVADYCAAIDPYRVNEGGKYPMVATVSEPTSSAYANGDMRAIDSYGRQDDHNAIASYLSDQLVDLRVDGEPAFIHEWGGNLARGIDYPHHYHNGLWGSAATGPMCTALLWCDGYNYPLPAAPDHFPAGGTPTIETALLDHLEILADFAAGAPALGASDNEVPEPVTELDLNTGDVDAYAVRSGDAAVAWFHAQGFGATPAFSAWFTDLDPGLYVVEWFDPWSSGSSPILTDAAAYGDASNLMVSAPALAQPDIALRLRRYAATNTAPSFTGGDVAVPAVGGAVSQAWASAITAGSVAEDEVQTMAFDLEVDDPDLFAVLPTVAVDGTLRFTPAGVPGATTATATLQDDGGTAGGGDDTSVVVFTIDLTGRDVTLTITEDGSGVAGLEVSMPSAARSDITDGDGSVVFDHLSAVEHRFALGTTTLKNN